MRTIHLLLVGLDIDRIVNFTDLVPCLYTITTIAIEIRKLSSPRAAPGENRFTTNFCPKLSSILKSVLIHIVEGNHNLRSLLAWHLQQAGYRVQQSPTLKQAYQLCARGSSALVIVDADLPDGEGIEFCKWLYPQGNSLVLMLSARIREIDRKSVV